MSFKFENLKIWQDSVKFAGEIYKITNNFQVEEKFGLTSQLNRAAVSISLNIAEGAGRNSDADMSRFIQMAIGSLNEVVTILYISLAQGYIEKKEFDLFYKRCEDISRSTHAFRNYLKPKK